MSNLNEDEVSTMIDDCENRESRLSDWELGFISSISERVGRGNSLTALQLSRLNEIWEKVT